MIRVLFVCLGNICRSPMAEAVFLHKVKQAGLEDQIEADLGGNGRLASGTGSASRHTADTEIQQYRLRAQRAADRGRGFSRVRLYPDDGREQLRGRQHAASSGAFGRRQTRRMSPRLMDYAPDAGNARKFPILTMTADTLKCTPLSSRPQPGCLPTCAKRITCDCKPNGSETGVGSEFRIVHARF